MILGVVILVAVCGAAVGCNSNSITVNPGTTTGNYTVTVTGTDAATGKTTASTVVKVTID
jgi:hypothetical protein